MNGVLCGNIGSSSGSCMSGLSISTKQRVASELSAIFLGPLPTPIEALSVWRPGKGKFRIKKRFYIL